MVTEVVERLWSVERGMWEWRIGMEDERSVPLEERIVIWIGKEALQNINVSISFLILVALRLVGRTLMLVEAR